MKYGAIAIRRGIAGSDSFSEEFTVASHCPAKERAEPDTKIVDVSPTLRWGAV